MASPGGHDAAPRPLTGNLAAIRLEMATHLFGTLAVTRAFSPQQAAQGISAVLNILSALSWLSVPGSGAYCAAQSGQLRSRRNWPSSIRTGI